MNHAKIIFFILTTSMAGYVAANAAITHTIVIEGMKFIPSSMTVKKGDTVIWVNKDIFPHTATSENKKFDSAEISAGSSWQYKAKTTGEFNYLCRFHPTMKATLLVK